MPPRPLRRALAAGTSAVLVAAIAGCTTHPSPELAVRAFLLDWQGGEYESAARQTTGDVDEVASALERTLRQLDLAGLKFELGGINQDGDTATAKFDVSADLGIGDPVWEYTGSMALEDGDSGWKINWEPNVIHPDLGADERLAVDYDVPDRGQIYDRQGQPLVAEQEVTAFGVVPDDMGDIDEGVNGLAELLDEDPGPLLNRVRSAPPEQFQPLVLVRKRDVEGTVTRQAKRIDGVETKQVTIPLHPEQADAAVGEVAGTVGHNVSSRVAGPYQAGDTVGLSGLQNAFQQRLAGTASTDVVTLDSDGAQTDVLRRWPGEPSGSLSSTLDSEVQEAAEGSLESILSNKPGYLVAVDSGSGEVLAAAGNPGNTEDDGAFTKEYRPGEVFTIVSAAAAMDSGAAGPDQQVPCEQSQKVGDRTFRNPNDTALWDAPDLARGFAYTCTTAFAGLGKDVGGDALASAAEDFGVGGDWRLSVPTHTGEFPVPSSAEDTAAAMVGRGDVTVSPLTMALVAGAVADGTWHPPRLSVTEEERDSTPPRELNADTVSALQDMMEDAVVEGSASGADISQEIGQIGQVPVHGQVSTATQKIDGKKTAVQWFVGYQGDVAVAVAIEVKPALGSYDYAENAVSEFLLRMPDGYVEDVPELAENAENPDSDLGEAPDSEGSDGSAGTSNAAGE
ncbi:cell division protein FtsI/penicillin-binding protein 2 [Lipingzhangella halophila]|uniref:Cell division protein FtsI/penicillin-binding protein 2 n=1 Tax=Lipingzhangella halophila TaxID=1783352 RepID=A0A7W7RLP8_9ACTN|nr:penicillin-binding transpeptidase domain-containing protein [Lipingzhangella halophila]MBB4933848.1 cell division protein FtsI/penicillin-binding protein 2 [Lipingzhangella halophila]